MPSSAWLLLLCLGTATAAAAQDPSAVTPPAVVSSRALHLPGCAITVEVPPAWELANPVEGANLVLQGPLEHAMPLGEALASRPMISITVNVLKPGETRQGLAHLARSQYERLFSHFSVLSGNEATRTFSGRDWEYLHYTFELAQQTCNQELYISASNGVALYVVCSCAPSRAGAYQEVFSNTLASMGGGSGTPLLGQPLAPAR